MFKWLTRIWREEKSMEEKPAEIDKKIHDAKIWIENELKDISRKKAMIKAFMGEEIKQ